MYDGVLTNKDIYLPVTLKCAQEFVLAIFHSYNALTNRHDIAISHIKNKQAHMNWETPCKRKYMKKCI